MNGNLTKAVGKMKWAPQIEFKKGNYALNRICSRSLKFPEKVEIFVIGFVPFRGSFLPTDFSYLTRESAQAFGLEVGP